jgi:putative permease
MEPTGPTEPQPQPPRRPGEWDQFTRQAAIVLLMLGVLFLLNLLRPLLNLLAVTGIFILILSYPINRLHNRAKMAYPVAVLVVFIPLAVLLALFYGEMLHWAAENVQKLIAGLAADPHVVQDLEAAASRFAGSPISGRDMLAGLATFAGRELVSTAHFITLTGISFFLAFLFILEMPANLAHSFRTMPEVTQHEFGILFDRLSNVWNGWLRSTVITSIIIGVSTALVLFLFGIPYAGLLGVIAGFLNLIPTIGPFISYLLIIVVTYTQGSTRVSLSPATLTLVVWAILLIINQVVRLYIFPRLAGKAVHLPVFLVILGLVVAAVLWGVVGVILVVPLLGTVRELLQYVLRKINRQDPYPGEEPRPGFWAREFTEN